MSRAGRPSIEVDLNGLTLPGPVLVASGCFGTGRDAAALFDRRGLGGVVTRSVTVNPRRGAPSPRLSETPSGLLSMVGLQNPGIGAFVANDLPTLAETGLPIIASIAGGSVEEFVRLAAFLDGAPGVVALEAYLACEDEELEGRPWIARPDRAAEVAGAVARRASVPVFAKLPAMTAGLVETATACVRAGAHGLTLIDGVPAMGVDAASMRPTLGGTRGYLSGPAMRPVALRAVHEVATALPDVPLFGVGGIRSGIDAAETLLAGAWAVQVGTAMLVDPSAPAAISRDLVAYLGRKGVSSPDDLRGRIRIRDRELPAAEAEA
jgi:dihydroorotate dehydrogenase (NAD+) catalytic subunit